MSTNNLAIAYDMVMSAETTKCSWLNIGDSLSTDVSSNCNLGFGMQRTFRPTRWGGRAGRIVMGPAAWAMAGNNITTGSAFADHNPGATIHSSTPTVSLINPVPVSKWEFSANQGAGSIFSNGFIADPVNYGTGDVWGSNLCYVRQPYYRQTNGLQVTFRGIRNTNTAASPTYSTINSLTVDTKGTPGWQAADISCGSGAGMPGVQVVEGGVDESTAGANQLVLAPRAVIRGALGTDPVGFYLADNATGGHNALDALRALGGDGANATCTQDNAQWFWNNLYFKPNIVHICLTQNKTTPVINELNAGVGTTFRAQHLALLTQIRTLAIAANSSMPFVILSHAYNTAWSALNVATASAVLRDLAAEWNGAFIDYSSIMPVNPAGSNGWWTGDDVHPSGPQVGFSAPPLIGNGAEVWGMSMWSAMRAAWDARNQYVRRPIVMRRMG
jgi:hypothetical protein